jgi:hypothetical protein
MSAPEVNASDVMDGVNLSDLPPGARLELETANHRYSLLNLGNWRVRISGHPRYCPEPTEVTICGSSSGGSLLKPGYVGRGMRLAFSHPTLDVVTTSPILGLRLC